MLLFMGSWWRGVLLLVVASCAFTKTPRPTTAPATPATGSHSGIETVAVAAAVVAAAAIAVVAAVVAVAAVVTAVAVAEVVNPIPPMPDISEKPAMPNVTGSMALVWSNFLKIRANQVGVGTYVTTIFMQIQSFLYWVCAEQRSPRTLQSHDEQTTSKNVNLWVATLLASGKGEHISTNKYWNNSWDDGRFLSLFVCVCVYFCTMFSGCSMFVRMHHSIKNPSANDPTDSNSWVCRPALHTRYAGSSDDKWPDLSTSKALCPWEFWPQFAAKKVVESHVKIWPPEFTRVLAHEEGLPWFALKSCKSWLCKPRDSNCSMKGTMSSHLHMSQESLVAIESMRRTLHWAGPSKLKLSRSSLNSLLPQHHDVSTIYAQLSQIKLKIQSPTEDPSRDAAKEARQVLHQSWMNICWKGWEYWMMLLKLTKPPFCILFSAYSFWMFLMNMVFHVFSPICFSIYSLSFAMHQDSIRICGGIEPRNSMRMPMQNSNLSTPLPSLQWKKIGPGDIVEMVWSFCSWISQQISTTRHQLLWYSGIHTMTNTMS